MKINKDIEQTGIFYDESNRPYLTRCPVCERENYSLSVAVGVCYCCGFDVRSLKENIND